MTRSALPQNYKPSSGTLVDVFSSASGWATPTPVRPGTWEYDAALGGLKVSGFDFTHGLQMYKSPSISDFAEIGRSMDIDIYVADKAQLKSIAPAVYFCIYGSSDRTVYFIAGVYVGDLRDGWNHISIYREDWAASGGMTWNTPVVSIGLFLYAVSDVATPVIAFKNWRMGFWQTGSIVITFDDGFASEFDTAWPLMQARGIKGTYFINSNSIDTTSRFMKTADLVALNAAGCCIANHSHHHYYMDNSDPTHPLPDVASQVAEMQLCDDYLALHGLERGRKYFGYPFGKWNEDTLAALEQLGFVAARGNIGSYKNYTYPPCTNNYLTGTVSISKTTSLATALGYVDYVRRNGCTWFVMLHEIDVAPEETSGWYPDRFEAWLDYIIASRVSTLTFDEWYNGLTNPRYQSLPVGRSPL